MMTCPHDAKLLLIDNYDSFTYNLYDYLLQLGVACDVVRNDECSFGELKARPYTGVVLSPGPKTPTDAGFLMEAVAWYAERLPLLGVCLGHQAIGMHYGAKLVRGPVPVHGKVSILQHKGHPLFAGLDKELEVMRYHSLVLDSLEGSVLEATAFTEDGIIMALAHRHYPIAGVQFHPESVLTPDGLRMLQNWLEWSGILRKL